MINGELLQNWMRERFGPGLELMATYIADVEKECDRSISEYQQSDEGYEKSAGCGEHGDELIQWVSSHKGLTDDAWCLEEIFEHYFPTAKRGAALTALCGYMEHELNELCRNIESHIVVTVSVEDMKGQGISRAELYLRKVGNVVMDDALKDAWKRMQEAYNVRNTIVHAGGRTEKQNIQQIVKSSPYLGIRDEAIDIRAGYLQSVIDVFADVGRALDAALKWRFGPVKTAGQG